MNKQDATPSVSTFRIGAVSRLTGVAPDTLRVWERRYKTVKPYRSDTGTRLYSQDDIGRLTLIKALVDRGDAISCVANLSKEKLEERIRGSALPQVVEGPERPCRVLVLGPTLADTLADKLGREETVAGQVEIVGSYKKRDALLAQTHEQNPDILVVELATIQPEQIREIGALLVRVGAACGIVVYNFAARATLERLGSPRIVPMRGPVDPAELRRLIRVLHGSSVQPPSLLDDVGVDISGPLPSRRFDDASLSRIAAASVTVRCECPHHLVNLISSLTAFETYSEECEVLNVDDAALHAFLHSATAQARALLETALARVVEADDIAIEDAPGDGS